VLGDLDLDGDVDFDDIDDFVLGLNDEAAYAELHCLPAEVLGDMDMNGDIDFDDIDEFVAALTGGSVSSDIQRVPEPATWSLGLLGLMSCVAYRLMKRNSG